MTQTESLSLEQDLACQTENPGAINPSVQETLESPFPVAQAALENISGFWRRIIAFAVDVLIIAAIGFVVGTLFFNALARMGSQGFWVGLLIAVGYFGWMNSSFNNGQTIGKRLMKIRVVDALGNTIPLGRSIQRSALLLVPLIYAPVSQSVVDLVLKAIMLFIMVAVVYLYLLNIKTRQSAHDLVLKTFVVNADYNLALEEIPVKSRQFMIMTTIGLVVIGFSMFALPRVLKEYTVLGTGEAIAELQKDPDVYQAMVKRVVSDSPNRRTTGMEIAISVRKLPAPIYMKAKQISDLVMKEMPAVQDMNSLTVTVNYGYNIGIAWYQKSVTYTGTPCDWQTDTVKIAKSAHKDVSLGIGQNSFE